MSDAITTQAGVTLGSWDGGDFKELEKELKRIRQTGKLPVWRQGQSDRFC